MCDKAFSQSGDLNVHVRIHTGDKPYKCSLCNKSFNQLSNLQTHKRCIHSNRKPHQCRYCGKLFNTNGHLTCHVRIHTDAKPYSCRHCSERFTHHVQLKRHLLKSHNEGTWSTCRISAAVVTLRHIYVDMKVWSRMFAVNVQSVSIQQLHWKFISWHTQTTNSFAVVYVVNISKVYVVLKDTSRDVLISWELTMSGPPWREGNRKTINITLTFSILLSTVVVDCMNNLQDISTKFPRIPARTKKYQSFLSYALAHYQI